jgi:hypothetical protein
MNMTTESLIVAHPTTADVEIACRKRKARCIIKISNFMKCRHFFKLKTTNQSHAACEDESAKALQNTFTLDGRVMLKLVMRHKEDEDKCCN